MTSSTWNNLRFTLPLPARTNALTRPANVGGKARLVKSKQGKEWLQVAANALRFVQCTATGVRPLLVGPVWLELTFLYDSIVPDIDGRIKSLMDVLKGVCWEDDRQVCKLEVLKLLTEPGQDGGLEDQRVHVMMRDATELFPAIAKRLAAARDTKDRRATRALKKLGLQPAVYR